MSRYSLLVLVAPVVVVVAHRRLGPSPSAMSPTGFTLSRRSARFATGTSGPVNRAIACIQLRL
jgi:hypothetical protein